MRTFCAGMTWKNSRVHLLVELQKFGSVYLALGDSHAKSTMQLSMKKENMPGKCTQCTGKSDGIFSKTTPRQCDALLVPFIDRCV